MANSNGQEPLKKLFNTSNIINENRQGIADIYHTMERHQQQLDETLRLIVQVRINDQQQQLLEFGQRQQLQDNLIGKILDQYRKLYQIELAIVDIQQQFNQTREAQESRFNEIQQNYVRLQETLQNQTQEVQDHNAMQEQRAQLRQVTDDLLRDLDLELQQQLNELEQQVARLCDRIRELQIQRRG